MAKLTLTDAHVTFGGEDLSAYVKSLTLKLDKDIHDASAMSDTWSDALSGAKHWSGSIEWYQDYAASKVDATCWTAFDATTATTILFKPTTAAVSGTNPSYGGDVEVPSFTPLGGEWNQVLMAPMEFTGASTCTRATS